MSANLPPLPRGRRMGSGVINGKLIELFMHDDAAMTSYATAAISAQAAEVEALRKTLKKVVKAWESLDEGEYSSEEIEEWLGGPMKKAIDAARAALKETS